MKNAYRMVNPDTSRVRRDESTGDSPRSPRVPKK